MMGIARRAHAAAVAAILLLLACVPVAGAEQYVVQVEDSATPTSVAKAAGVRPDAVFDTAMNGFVADLSASQVKRLERDGNVLDVREDSAITTMPFEQSPFKFREFDTDPFKFRPFKFREFGGNPFKFRPFKFRPFKFREFEGDPFKFRPFKFRPFKFRTWGEFLDAVLAENQWADSGVQRVGALESPTARLDGVDERVDADIAVIDSGVQPDHPDLNVAGGVNCVDDGASWADPVGHGTMVAGHAAALDNDRGVVGVAPGARIWSVRVARADGVVMESAALCGLEWVVDNADHLDVANMSWGASGVPSDDCGAEPGVPESRSTDRRSKRKLRGRDARSLVEAIMRARHERSRDRRGGSGDPTVDPVAELAIHGLICDAVAAGVTMVAAAGNESADTAQKVPAAYPEVITVSALADSDGKPGGEGGRAWCMPQDKDDTLAHFSNYGAAVTIAAPGVCLLSTTVEGGYDFGSGTSFATPIAAGAAALLAASDPTASPAQIQERLVAAAEPGPVRKDRDRHPEGVVNVATF